MKLSNRLAAGAAVSALSAFYGGAASAQDITTAIRGVVTGPDGAPLAGESVIVTDTRTGVRRSVTTNSAGGFTVGGLESGGPFTIRVDSEDYQDELITDVFTSLGRTANFNISLGSLSAGGAEEIVVTASASSFTQLAIGPSATFGLETLQNVPSISRGIRDTIRLDPRVSIDRSDGGNGTGISCLGGNNRFNAFTIDGVRNEDAFGLNSSGFPSRNTLPIPFDAIRETSVEFSPYSVEYGQSTGCQINIVTKGGTNEFHGSAFGVFNSDGLTGSKLEGDNLGGDPFNDWNWGAEIGGPIIKDKLFFYAAYEEVQDGGDQQEDGPEDGNFANSILGLTTAEANQIASIIEDTYGFETGGIATILPESSRRILGRVDWNITDNHRAAFTYSRLRESNIEPDDFGFDSDFTFANTFEEEGSEVETYSVRLFSQWTENFSTEFRASRNDKQDLQGPVGGGEAQSGNPIPRFETIFDSGRLDANGDPIDPINILNGPGQFRSANDLRVQIDQIKAKGEYLWQNHTFTAGYELDQLDVFNLFVQNATGTFLFDSPADLQAGQASFISGAGSFTGDINDAAAEFSRSIHTIYIQDEWQITPALTLTGGLRYDFYESSDAPAESQAFVDRYGFTNTTSFDGLDIILPRFGFTYEPSTDFFGTTVFRGGAGIFSGGDPSVWFSNAFSNSGGNQADDEFFLAEVTADSLCQPEDFNVLGANGFEFPGCLTAAQIAGASEGNGRTDAIDPNFKLPSIVRGSIGLTHFTDFGGAAGGLFDDWTIQLDVIHSRRRNAPDFVDLTLTPTGELAPDGRPLFNAVDPLLAGCDAEFLGPRLGFSGDVSQGGPCDAGGNDQDILLTNTNGGGSTTLSAIFAKTFDYTTPVINSPGSFDFSIGYAFTNAKDRNPTTSSTSTSNFEEVAVEVINDPALAPTQFFDDHNIVIGATFMQEFVRDFPTRMSLFFQARSGRRFSYAYDNNTATSLFGDSDNEERNLFYVPTGPDDPLVDFQFDSPAEEAEFFQFLEDSGLNEFAGQISPRNQSKDPWFKDLDIRFQQDLPGALPGHRLRAFVDIENFLNLIDDGSNVFREQNRGDVGEAVPVVDAAINDQGQYVYSNFQTFNAATFDRDIEDSVWAVQFGLRYEF